MSTHRIEIRTPTFVLPTLQLRRMSAVLVLQLAPRDARPVGGGSRRAGRERALAAASERAERARDAAHAARLGSL